MPIAQENTLVSTCRNQQLELALQRTKVEQHYKQRWTGIILAIGDLIDLNLYLIETLFGGGSSRVVILATKIFSLS